MKFASFLIVSIINGIIWASVKTTSTPKGLARHEEKDYTATKMLNDGAESSVNPQIQKFKETLKPKLKNTKKDKDGEGNNVSNRSEYKKEYYQKNKEKMLANMRKYQKQNREKINEIRRNYYKKNKESINHEKRRQYMKIYRQENKERIQKTMKKYNQNNKEKLNENRRKYRQNKKNVQSNNNEGTSFVNPQAGDFTNLVKLANVCEESFEKENLFNQKEENCNRGEDEENQIEVEEPNKILEDKSNTNHMDSMKKILPFDLNEEPEDE